MLKFNIIPYTRTIDILKEVLGTKSAPLTLAEKKEIFVIKVKLYMASDRLSTMLSYLV